MRVLKMLRGTRDKAEDKAGGREQRRAGLERAGVRRFPGCVSVHGACSSCLLSSGLRGTWEAAAG